MTRAEFDVWIEQHYAELMKVARARTNSAEDAADVLHSVVAGAIDHATYVNVVSPWTFYVNAVRGYAVTIRRSNDRQGALKRVVKSEAKAAGFSHGWKRPAPRAE